MSKSAYPSSRKIYTLSRRHLSVCVLALILLCAVRGSADTVFTSSLDGLQQTPANYSTAAGVGSIVLNDSSNQVTVTLYCTGLGVVVGAEIVGPGGTIFSLPGATSTQSFPISSVQATELRNGLWQFNVRTSGYSAGEIRGRIALSAVGAPVSFPFSNGRLDATFGMMGTVVTPIGPLHDVPQAVAIQPDGKIVVAGYGLNGANNDFAIARYQPNGTLDDTFDGEAGGNGIVLTPVGTSHDQAFGIAIQPDGKIILVGDAFGASDNNVALVRYSVDGRLDGTFGTTGRVITAIGPGDDSARGIALQPDGKIVVAGSSSNGTNSDIAVMRYEANGTLDVTFDGPSGSGNGIVTIPLGPGNDFAYGVAVQPDAKIVVAGYFNNGSNADAAVLRFAANGILDTTFGGDGIVTSAAGPGTDEALALALAPDGKIVVAGCTNSGAGNDFLIIRYTSSGEPDLTFSSDGIVVAPIGSSIDIAFGVAVQPDAKIVAAGFSSNGVNNDFALVRVNNDGVLDQTFDGDGRVTTPVGSSADIGYAVAIQPDGKIVAVGRTVNTTADFGIARYGYGVNVAGNDGFIATGVGTAVRFENATVAGTMSGIQIDLRSLPPLPAGMRAVGNPRQIRTNATFIGDIIVRLALPTAVDQSTFDAARILFLNGETWTDVTAMLPQREFQSRSLFARSLSDGIFVPATSAPFPSRFIRIIGRVMTADGRPVGKSIVRLADENGLSVNATTNPFGYFQFKNIPSEATYRLLLSAKNRNFAPRVISSVEDIDGLTLTAAP